MYFLTLFCVIVAFITGLFMGVELGVESVSNSQIDLVTNPGIKVICDACDSSILEHDAVFCENCFDDDDKFTTAIKEKELEIRYITVALHQRNLVNRPEREELEKLRRDVDKISRLCENVQKISTELCLKIDLAPLKERNNSLIACIEKWEKINKREEKLDDILQEKSVKFEKNLINEDDNSFDDNEIIF